MRIAVVLFAFALALRLLFWFATPDHAAAWNVAFQGDAPLWQELAQKLHAGQPDELLRLPLRPPGMLWFVHVLWSGDAASAFWPRLWFAVLGAAIAPLLFLLLRRHLQVATAASAAGLCAASSNLIVLGSGLHSELPYLVLFLLTLVAQERLPTAKGVTLAVAFGALHAACCLLRAEHVLTFVLLLSVPILLRQQRWRSNTLVAMASFVLCLLPWHLSAWSRIDAYNTAGAPELPPAGEAAAGMLPWEAPALAALRELPAFQQAPVYGFVSDTVRVRGGRSVAAADLEVVREAYGSSPEPLPHAFLCLYGGLNFFLANSVEADGGFSQRALDRPPPLAGGDARYPPGLRRVLPRDGTLALSYPPHLDLLVHGYRHGLTELWSDPVAGARRIGKKLWHGCEGAAGGVGGAALPIGLSGERRAVDLVTAGGWWPATFRVLLLGLSVAGLWSLRRQAFLWPWLLFALSKLVVLMAFFGYARQGALLVPVVSIGVAVAWQRWLVPLWPAVVRMRAAVVVMVALLAVELVRTLVVEVAVDDVLLLAAPDASSVGHAARRIEYRW